MGLAENIAQYGLPGDVPVEQEDTGALGHVLWTLSLLDRPRSALASGVYNLTDEDPATGFWSGARKGFMGERDVSWGDVFGWEPTKPTDTWAEYIRKGTPRLAADVVLDPLNLLFGAGGLTKPAQAAGKLGKIGQATQAIRKATGITAFGKNVVQPTFAPAVEAVRGSRPGKVFSMRGPDWMEDIIMEAKRTGDIKPLQDLAAETQTKLSKHLEQLGITDPQDIRQAIEYDLPLAIETGKLGGRATQEMLDIVQPLQRMAEDIELERIAAKNRLASRFYTEPSSGLIPEEHLPGGKFLPHLLSGRGEWQAARLGKTRYHPAGMGEVHRQLRVFEDVGGNIHGVGRLDELGKLERAGKLSTTIDDTGRVRYWSEEGYELFPRHATLDEIEASGRYKGGWIRHPVAAYTKKAIQSKSRTTYMRMIEGMADATTPDGMRVLLSATDPDLPKGYRALKLKGFEDYALPGSAANRLENIARLYDPDSVSGVLDHFVKDTWVGKGLESYTRWWKRNQLAPFPGYLVANAISDLSLAYMQGLTDIRMLEYGRRVRGIGGKVGRGSDVLDGIGNAELREAFRTRGLVDSGQFRILGEPGIEQTLREASEVPFLEMITGKMGRPGAAISSVGKGWRWFNDKFFQVGQWEQESVQAALAIDYLKKALPKGGRPTERQLNDAARHAQDALFDYGDLPALQDTLRRVGAVPFIAWTSNIMRRFLLDAVEQPQRLARLGRFYDFAFRPLNSPERALMPEWMQEQAPVPNPFAPLGFGGPTTLLGRFLPHGNIEQFGYRPGETAFNVLGPLFKGPIETATNFSVFKNRPIDELAGGYLGGLFNPLRSAMGAEGVPYSLAGQTTFPGVRLPATWEHGATTYLPSSRLLTSLGTLGAGTVFEDPNRMPMSWGAKAGWITSGGKTFEFDQDKALSQAYRKYQRELATLKSKFRYAQRKGDIVGQQHYMRLWQELRRNGPRQAIDYRRNAQAMVEPAN